MKAVKNISFILFLATLIWSCTKNDGATPVPVAKVSIPKIVKKSGDVAIDVTNFNAFAGEFEVGLLFPDDERPVKHDVVIRKNGDANNVKVFKADVTTFPTKFTFKAADIVSLFGTAAVLNDNYDIGVDVYMADGKKYQAFPAVGVGYGAGVVNLNGSSTSVRYSAICKYNPDIYAGNFEVVKDDFGDTAPGDVITLTKVSDTEFSYIYPSLVNPKPIVVKVNPLDNSLTITKQVVGTKFTWAAYTNPAIAASGANNFVAPCDGKVTIQAAWTVDQGSFGAYEIVLKKK